MSVLKQVEGTTEEKSAEASEASGKDYVVFMEASGRTIYGLHNKDKSDGSVLAVTNPAVIFVNANQQTGQFGVQVIPYLFREFAREGTVNEQTWLFNRSSITLALDVEIDDKLRDQHTRIFSAIEMPPDKGIVTPQQAAQEEAAAGKTVKLFDDK